jgi:hypothetical protein
MSYYLQQFNLAARPDATRLFLAEGETEVAFIELCLESLGVDPDTTAVLCFKGLSKVYGHTATLAKLLAKEQGGLERIRSIGLMADADDNPQGRVDLVIACAKELGFPKSGKELRDTSRCEADGRKFCFALSPDRDAVGNFETLALKEVADAPIYKCMAQSFDCIERESGTPVSVKARAQMYISAVANSSMAGVGHALRGSIFDPQHVSYAAARGMIDYVLA